MKTWPTKKLGEVCEVVGGGTPSTRVNDYWGNDYFWITPKDLGQITTIEVSKSGRKISKAGLKNSSAQLLPIGSVILSSRAPIGYVVINTVEIATNQGCRSFVCGSKIYNRYLYYFLSLNTDYLNSLGSGSTFREVSGSRLKEVEIPLPPLEIQRKIVKKIEELFAKISQVQSLREFAIHNTNNLIPAALNKIFEEGKSKGWEEKALSEICEKTSNINWNEYKDERFQYIDLSAVSRKDFSIVKTQEVNFKNAPSRAKKIINTCDVIFGTTRPTLMRVTIIPKKYDKHICSTGFVVLRAREGRVLPQFIYYFIRSKQFMYRMENIQTGASYPAVSDTKVLETKIPLPPLAEQKEIVEKMDALTQKVRELQKLQSETAANLTALKQSVLHKAFQGELIN